MDEKGKRRRQSTSHTYIFPFRFQLDAYILTILFCEMAIVSDRMCPKAIYDVHNYILVTN